MQEGCGFKEKVELAQAAGTGVSAGYAPDAGKQVLNRCIRIQSAKNDFVRVLEAETDSVTISQDAMLYFVSVDENAGAVATVLKRSAITLQDNRGALAGDAAIDELEMISGLSPAADEKR
jgi:hypothetical protein